jgi:hypothetical protein
LGLTCDHLCLSLCLSSLLGIRPLPFHSHRQQLTAPSAQASSPAPKPTTLLQSQNRRPFSASAASATRAISDFISSSLKHRQRDPSSATSPISLVASSSASTRFNSRCSQAVSKSEESLPGKFGSLSLLQKIQLAVGSRDAASLLASAEQQNSSSSGSLSSLVVTESPLATLAYEGFESAIGVGGGTAVGGINSHNCYPDSGESTFIPPPNLRGLLLRKEQSLRCPRISDDSSDEDTDFEFPEEESLTLVTSLVDEEGNYIDSSDTRTSISMGTVLSFSPRGSTSSDSLSNQVPPDIIMTQTQLHQHHHQLNNHHSSITQPFKKHSLFLNALSWKKVTNKNKGQLGTQTQHQQSEAQIKLAQQIQHNNSTLTGQNTILHNNINNSANINPNHVCNQNNLTHNNNHSHHQHHHGSHNNNHVHHGRMPLDTVQPYLNNQHNINNNLNHGTNVKNINSTKIPPVLSHRGESLSHKINFSYYSHVFLVMNPVILSPDHACCLLSFFHLNRICFLLFVLI